MLLNYRRDSTHFTISQSALSLRAYPSKCAVRNNWSTRERKLSSMSVKSPNFTPKNHCRYLAFYKPYGYLCQFTPEPGSDKGTLAQFGFPKNVYAIGRLDWDSEGLLLLSDDGDLNFSLLSPKNKHSRTYAAQVENLPEAQVFRRLESGIVINGQRTLPAKARLMEEPVLPPRAVPIRLRKNIPTAWIELSLHEGRNRQVRKMTAAVGHPTLRLVRISIGKLDLLELDLQPGQWTELTAEQILLAFAH
jgi:23S rRNA pseudouridine2457 synthase